MAKRRKPNRNPDHGKGLIKRMAGLPVSAKTRKDQPPEVFHVMSFEITWDVMPDPATDALPKPTRDRMDRMFELLKSKPKSVIAELRELTAQHPEVPCLANWLISALRQGTSAEQDEALNLSKQMFHDLPGYFFARTTLVDLLLDRGQIDQAAMLLFVPGHSIKTLYPNRKVFHISEIRHWAYLSARAKILLGEPDIAKGYRDMLEELEPGSPAVLELNRMLDGSKSGIMRILAGLRKLAVKARESKDHHKTIEADEPPQKPVPKSRTNPARDPDQLELFE